MKSRALLTAIFPLLTCLLLASTPAGAETLSNFQLHPPLTDENAAYLGVPAGKELKLSDIKADYLLIEIFSMYCPYCQAEAKHVNVLFEMIQKNHPDKLKLIGIGAGNTMFEVEYFKKKYDIKFPVFSDGEYLIHKQVGQVGTPYFYLLEKQKDGSLKILLTQEGAYKDTETFYKSLMAKSGLK